MVMYETRREELEEMPLVRADGLPTQHMRALAYWSAAPELDDVISLQVCGTEWVAHVTCRRQLIDALGVVNGNGHGSAKGGGPPTHDVFHGMVARERQAITSSKEGALLIDDLAEWIEAEVEADPERAAVAPRAPAPGPDRRPQVALGYFLLQPTTKRVEFEPEKLLVERQRQPRLGPGAGAGAPRRPARRWPERGRPPTPTTASPSSSRRCTGATCAAPSPTSTPVPLARYLSHFARWYGEAERAPRGRARSSQAVLDQGVRGLGLEAA